MQGFWSFFSFSSRTSGCFFAHSIFPYHFICPRGLVFWDLLLSVSFTSVLFTCLVKDDRKSQADNTIRPPRCLPWFAWLTGDLWKKIRWYENTLSRQGEEGPLRQSKACIVPFQKARKRFKVFLFYGGVLFLTHRHFRFCQRVWTPACGTASTVNLCRYIWRGTREKEKGVGRQKEWEKKKTAPLNNLQPSPPLSFWPWASFLFCHKSQFCLLLVGWWMNEQSQNFIQERVRFWFAVQAAR